MRENETSITFVDSMGVLAEIESETFPQEEIKGLNGWLATEGLSLFIWRKQCFSKGDSR